MARSHDDQDDGGPPSPQRQRNGRRARFSISPQNLEELNKETISEWFKDHNSTKSAAWALRYARLLSETPTQKVLETMTIWDSDVVYGINLFVVKFATRDREAQDLLGLPRADVADLAHLAWWRKAVVKDFEFNPPTTTDSAKLITVRSPVEEEDDDEPEAPDPRAPAQITQRKTPRRATEARRGNRYDFSLPSGSDSSDDDFDRCNRCDQSRTSTTTGDAYRRVKKEAVGTFDPTFKDPKKTGLVISQGKQVYTDVYLFCKHLRVFECYGEDSL